MTKTLLFCEDLPLCEDPDDEDEKDERDDAANDDLHLHVLPELFALDADGGAVELFGALLEMGERRKGLVWRSHRLYIIKYQLGVCQSQL